MRRLVLFTMVALTMFAESRTTQSNNKLRVFISDSDSWETRGQAAGGTAGGNGGLWGNSQGGARPQTAEIMKTFSERCPGVTVTINREKADFVVLLEHEGGKDLVRRDNKFVVFNKDGDMIQSGSTRSLGNAVKDACAVIVAR